MQTFREFLAEEMKDPEFAEEYERVSAEEDEKLRAAMTTACRCTALPHNPLLPHKCLSLPQK